MKLALYKYAIIIIIIIIINRGHTGYVCTKTLSNLDFKIVR